MNDQQKKEHAEREAKRKARIRAAKERLAAVPANRQEAVLDRAAALEALARSGGSRDAAVTFLERALDEAALTATGRPRVIGAVDPDEKALREATETVVRGLTTELVGKARQMRKEGLTVVEIAQQLEVGVKAVRELLDDDPRGGKKKAAAAPPPRRRAEREHRVHKGARQERCPDCGMWRNAEQDKDGAYVKASDFRENRADCRTCYNRRWAEGNARRKAERERVAAGK